MNAPANAMTQARKLDTFKWLLKREFWENRGAFFWSQIVTGGIVAGLTLFGVVIGGSRIRINGDSPIDVSKALASRSPDELADIARHYVDSMFGMGVSISMMVLAFVVFFYCLSALYSERSDRSVLFWKSMPVSDTQTVLSKLAWAVLLAPLLALACGLALGIVLLVITSIGTLVVGIGVIPLGALFAHGHPFVVIAGTIAIVPAYAAWALPSVGWLMLCSAAARSKPFLWAAALPVLACMALSLMSLVLGLDLPLKALWSIVVGRGLLSVMPGEWALYQGHDAIVTGDINATTHDAFEFLYHSWHMFATADLWIGVVVGIGFIAAAIHLRRWRELAD